MTVCDFYFSVSNESSAWDVLRHWPVGWSGGRGILMKKDVLLTLLKCGVGLEEGEYEENCHCATVLCTIIMVHYEQFLLVGRLYLALILIGLALCVPSASVSSVFMVLYEYYFCLHPFTYLLVSWASWDWLLSLGCSYVSFARTSQVIGCEDHLQNDAINIETVSCPCNTCFRYARAPVVRNTSQGEAEWRISHNQCESVSKTRIAWARDRFYICMICTLQQLHVRHYAVSQKIRDHVFDDIVELELSVYKDCWHTYY